jgi:hypothetical protein
MTFGGLGAKHAVQRAICITQHLTRCEENMKNFARIGRSQDLPNAN